MWSTHSRRESIQQMKIVVQETKGEVEAEDEDVDWDEVNGLRIGIYSTQALAEAVLRFGVGTRVYLGELLERDGLDVAATLFTESTGRVVVSVPREDDVKFRGLCEGRVYPVARIGVTDASSQSLEIQDVFTVSLDELRSTHRGTLPARFGTTIPQ